MSWPSARRGNGSTGQQVTSLTDGVLLRLLRDYHHTFTKGYVQFDLESIFETRNYGDFRALYRMCHASRFIAQVPGTSEVPGTLCLLEQFYKDPGGRVEQMEVIEPRTYAELRQQWLQRVVRDYEPPEAQFEAEALQILRFAFRYAIDDVQDLLRNPERDRGEVLVALHPLSMSRLLARQEDVPALIELARTAREVRGPGSQYIEEAALEALIEVADEDVLPFLAECFRYSRARDSAARHRRTIVLKGITAIAVLTRNEEALALLDEALTHKTWRVRQAACRAIRGVGGMYSRGLPPSLVERLRYVARHDPSRDIRVGAQLALEESGVISSGT